MYHRSGKYTRVYDNNFVIVDDLYEEVTPTRIKTRKNKENAKMSDSEILTIAINRRDNRNRFRNGMV